MKVFDEFDLLLTDFNKVEERVFIRNISNFAEVHKEVVIKTYSTLLKEKNINIQLKYLVLKSIGEMKYKEFLPMIRDLLKVEDKVRIIYEGIKSLVRINTLSSYKEIVLFLRDNAETDFTGQIEENLREFFDKNKLVYHFDIFYRQRGEARGIDKSSDFLIKYLPDECIKDIIPALAGGVYRIKYETLKILKNRPNSIFYTPIYNLFKATAKSTDDKFFLLLAEALVVNASLSKLAHKIFLALKRHLTELPGTKRKLLSISLLRLNTPAMIDEVITIYPHLSYNNKLLVFENLDREQYGCFLVFIRKLLTSENNDELLEKITEVLIYAKDYDYLFRVLDEERMLRKEKLLGIIMDFDPPGIDVYVKDYIHPNMSTKVIDLSMEYILRHAADDYYDMIKNVFFSGIASEIKTLIIRHINRFSPFNQKLFMESVFDDIKVIGRFKKDFLFSMLGVMNEKKFNKEFETLILNRILIIMEESRIDDIINFIYFFDKYEINNEEDMMLIIEELRMIQNTILKSSNKGDLARMIHVLIKGIEKKARMKEYAAREAAAKQAKQANHTEPPKQEE